MIKIIKAVRAFWIDYLSRHKNNVDKALHIAGIPLAFYGFFLLFTGSVCSGLFYLFAGYILQWIGHTYFDKNEVGEWILIKKIMEKCRTSSRR